MTATYGPDVNLLSDALQADPYPYYAYLRRSAPVARVMLPNGTPSWQVVRYETARLVLADTRFSRALAAKGELGTAGLFGPSVLTSDPPDHGRLRRVLRTIFSQQSIEQLRPRIQAIVNSLIDRFPIDGGAVDIVEALAIPLPMIVITALLGVPVEHAPKLRSWTQAHHVVPSSSAERWQHALQARRLTQFIEQLVAGRRREHTAGARWPEDVLTTLLRAADEGQLTTEEVVGTISLLLFAGQESVSAFIGNAVLALLLHHDQLAALRAQPALVADAVEELLRYDPPFQRSALRIATDAVEVEGSRIVAGDAVMVVIASANRDLERFPHGDRLDVVAARGDGVSFGHGMHYCLGAHLARLESQVAIAALLARFPHMRLADLPRDIEHAPKSLFVRRVNSLPVQLRAHH